MQKGSSRTLNVRRELLDALAEKGSVRAFFASIILSILIPLYLVIARAAGLWGNYSTHMTNFLAILEVIQLAFIGRGYFMIVKRGVGVGQDICRFYYVLTFAMFAGISGTLHSISGSMLMYVLTALFMIVVPMWDVKEKLVFPAMFAVDNIISLAISHAGGREYFELIVMCLCAGAVSFVLQNRMLEHERVLLKLKDKTISSEKDPLTGLTNRRGLERKISVLWPYCVRNKTPIGIIEMDIDFFKKYNDRFGHPAGDKCLKMVARAIKQSAKRNTDIAARTGGEEFIVYVQGMNEKELIDLAMIIRNNIAELRIPHAYTAVSNYVTVSMGIATMIPGNASSFDTLYEKADKALYAAKSNGRNCVVLNGNIYGRMKKGIGTQISV